MADKYMEALDHGSEFLAHYGIKGMKWDASKKKSPAELLAEALKRKRRQQMTLNAVGVGADIVGRAAYSKLTKSAFGSTPKTEGFKVSRKTKDTYQKRAAEEDARRQESKKRNSRFNSKKDASNKKENVITENVITENVITEKSDKPLSDFKNKITEMAKKKAAKERQSSAKQTPSKKKEKYESYQMKKNRQTAENFRKNSDKLHRQVEDGIQESKAKERRMAEEKRIQDALKDREAEHNRRMNSEEERTGRARERNRLKDIDRRKAQKQQLDLTVLAKRARNRKDDIRRALNKAAKSGTNFSYYRR